MQILLQFGEYVYFETNYIKVWFDSVNPDDSAELIGHWFHGQYHYDPDILRAGYTFTDGIYTYRTLRVKGPLFDVGDVYHQKLKVPGVRQQAIDPAVRIVSRFWLPFVGWVYRFEFDKSPEVCTMREQKLLDFLAPK